MVVVPIETNERDRWRTEESIQKPEVIVTTATTTKKKKEGEQGKDEKSAMGCGRHFFFYALLVVCYFMLIQRAISEPLRNRCQLSKQIIPQFSNVTKTDELGRACRGTVALPFCHGFCKSSHAGSYTFPQNVYNNSACAFVKVGVEKVVLTDCEPGASALARFVEIPTGDCVCEATKT